MLNAVRGYYATGEMDTHLTLSIHTIDFITIATLGNAIRFW